MPDGTAGARVLVTNLFNRIQPLIRYEIPDVVTIDPEPCPCGRTLKRISSVHGRSDDLLTIDGVTVHPLQFAALAADPHVREFQVVQHGERLSLRIVPTDDARLADLTARLTGQITSGLRGLGIDRPKIAVELCETIERPASGKLPLVFADPRVRALA